MRWLGFIGLFWVVSFWVSAAELDRQRLDFLRAEQLLRQNNTAEFLTLLDELKDYPLSSYLKAEWLKKHLDQDEQIQQVLEQSPDNRVVDQLRIKWLPLLAQQGRWEDFERYYRNSDSLDLQCLHQQAEFQAGRRVEALATARQLWLRGEELPSQCDFILTEFKNSAEFSTALIWQRFDRALQNDRVRLAEFLKGMLPVPQQSVAKFWLKAHANPNLFESPEFNSQPPAYQGLIFADLVQQLARKNPSYACLLWDNHIGQLSLDEEHRQAVAHDLALQLAKDKGTGAFERLMKVTLVDDEIKDWGLRSALQESNWAHVQQAVEHLDIKDQTLPKWQYWQARALWSQDKKEQALQIFRPLAAKRDYYGFLAADFAELGYQLEDHPVVVQESELNQLLNSEGLKIVQEFRYFHRDRDAEAQWWFLIKRFDKAHILVAAKIAQQWHWQPIDMFTVVKAENMDDVNLRFPILYEAYVQQHADLHALNPAVVFGLIRQESAFAAQVSSSAGAKGLMQLMPTTAMQIARELKEPWDSSESLLDPETNIKYGTYYFSKLVRRFDGHYALAAAGYNAGPKRVDAWLPQHDPVAADIWIEMIPFKETRKYVSAVLAYAVIYQQRLQKNSFRIRDFMPDVPPL